MSTHDDDGAKFFCVVVVTDVVDDEPSLGPAAVAAFAKFYDPFATFDLL